MAYDDEIEFDLAEDPMGLSRKARAQGVAFTADLSAVGSIRLGTEENIFAADQADIIDEERRLIDKVFSIVDKDSSGTIDTRELSEMFKLFGVPTDFLKSSIERVMSNADKDSDANISPQEFYKLLSMKFQKGDSVEEMKDVFDKMGAVPAFSEGKERKDNARDNMTKVLDIDRLHKVALMLGETERTKHEIKDMIKCFKRLAQPYVNPEKEAEEAKRRTKPPKLRSGDKYEEGDLEKWENKLTLEEFVALMEMDL